ncbi:MAG: FG-GAP-like repeat-containing protein, partial [Planctomycetota bacterium]|nr:FG-GAP-like repeat-containing protein [Planctomycetota bacterium]
VDRDGDTDLVMVYKQLGTTTGKRRNVLLMNEGGVLVDRTTQFATASTVTLPPEVGGGTSQGFLDLTNDRDVIVVDVNGDGWPDIVTATSLSGIPAGTNGGKSISHPRVYINLKDDPPGSGIWQGFIFDDADRIPTQPTEPRFLSVSAGDVDGDLDPDLYFGDHDQGGSRTSDLDNRLLINNGSGYFSDESEVRMTYEQREVSFCQAVALVDMNRDGTLDAVRDSSHSSPTAISIAYNDPNNEGFFDTFNDGGLDHVYFQSPYNMSVGDLNNDLSPDIVITDAGSDRYILNTGIGVDGLANFGPPRLLVGSASSQFGGNNFIADLDKDGFNDVLVANVDDDLPNCSQPSKIFRNLGLLPDGFNVTLEEQGTGGIASIDLNGVHDFAVFDINGDTWLDLVIGRCGGTSVYIQQPPVAGLMFSYPQGLPQFLPESAVFEFQVLIEAAWAGEPVAGSGTLFLSIDGAPFTPIPMTELGPPNLYLATLPAGQCPTRYEFYLSAEAMSGGEVFSDPVGGAAAPFAATVSEGIEIAFEDDVEGDVSGWTVVNDASLSSGAWEQAIPEQTFNGPDMAAPGEDAEADILKVKAFVTQNCPEPPAVCGGHPAFDSDVDGGATDLISPTIDLAGSDATISYFRWFYTNSITPGEDNMVVQITNDGDSPTPTWVTVEVLTENTTDGGQTAWQGASFVVSDFIVASADVKVRFRIRDAFSPSVVEGGVDLFKVEAVVCPAAAPCNCPADVSDDGLIDGGDVHAFVECFMGGGSNCGCANLDPGPGLDENDVAAFVTEMLTAGSCP